MYNIYISQNYMFRPILGHLQVVPYSLVSVVVCQPVWQQLEYRIDVCRVTRGAHIEHL